MVCDITRRFKNAKHGQKTSKKRTEPCKSTAPILHAMFLLQIQTPPGVNETRTLVHDTTSISTSAYAICEEANAEQTSHAVAAFLHSAPQRPHRTLKN